MTNIILCGCNGKMGHAVQNLVHQREECSIVAGVDITPQEASPFPVYASLEAVQEQAQVVVDFSNPSALSSILEYCRSHPGTAAVLCTTGYSAEQTQEIQKAAKELPLFYSRNMSLGVNLLIELAKKAESVLGDGFDVEIVEMHHNQKIDAPSGTALMIADAINQVRENSMQYVYDRHSQRKKREKKGNWPALGARWFHCGRTSGDLRRTERSAHLVSFGTVERTFCRGRSECRPVYEL